MGLIHKTISRVSQYGFLYVAKVILKNRIYRPIDHVILLLEIAMFKKVKLHNKIVIESHNDFDTNGGAFYEYLIEHGLNKKYKIVWLIKNRKPNNLPNNVVCFNYYRPSFRKAFHICTAKFFMADDLITNKVRKDQKSFFLTHGGGIGFKRVDVPIPNSVDYILMPSEEFAPYALVNYHIPFPSEKLIYVGYPAQDYLYNSKDRGGELTKIIKDKKFRKCIIWMPTFRRGGGDWRNDSTAEQKLGIPLIDSLDKYEKLNRFLSMLNILLLIKIHPMQKLDNLGVDDRTNIKVLNKHRMKELNLDNYRLIADTDALISDYSTIAVEYLHTHNPIAFVLEDLDKYIGLESKESIDLMVGDKIYTLDDMMEFIIKISDGVDEYKEKREALFNRTHKYHDGKSCERLAEFMGLK